MARKKRQVAEQFQAAPTQDNKPKEPYQDDFQRNVNRRIEDVSKKVEGRGKNILYGIAAVAVLAVLIGIFFAWNRRSNAQAQTALGRAVQTSQGQVTESSMPGYTDRTFKTEKERSEAALAEFQAVADKFGGEVGDKAKYFAAVTKLKLDRPAAVTDLEGLAGKSGEIGTLSKFALAQAKADAGELDRAAQLYQELAGLSDPVIAKETINFELAKIYEKQGKKTEAADVYYNIAKVGYETKDADGKVTPSTTAREAKTKLEELNPERAKEIKEPEQPSMPSMPFGM